MHNVQIDPKYSIRVNADYSFEIVNPSGVPIPDDEPLILFRARDYLAVPMLEHYFKLAVADGCTDYHLTGIHNRIEAFRRFAAGHPERMKQPGVTRGASVSVQVAAADRFSAVAANTCDDRCA